MRCNPSYITPTDSFGTLWDASLWQLAREARAMQSVPVVLASEERTCLTVGKRSNPSSKHRQASAKSAARLCVLKLPGARSLLISKQPDLYAAITNSESLCVISVSLCVTIKRCVTLWLNSTPTDSFGTLWDASLWQPVSLRVRDERCNPFCRTPADSFVALPSSSLWRLASEARTKQSVRSPAVIAINQDLHTSPATLDSLIQSVLLCELVIHF